MYVNVVNNVTWKNDDDSLLNGHPASLAPSARSIVRLDGLLIILAIVILC